MTDLDITVLRAELAELDDVTRDARRAVALARQLLTDRDRLAARLDAAHDTLSRIDDADDDDFTTLESTVHYVVSHCRALRAAEEQAADEVERLRRLLADEQAAHATTRAALARALEGGPR